MTTENTQYKLLFYFTIYAEKRNLEVAKELSFSHQKHFSLFTLNPMSSLSLVILLTSKRTQPVCTEDTQQGEKQTLFESQRNMYLALPYLES